MVARIYGSIYSLSFLDVPLMSVVFVTANLKIVMKISQVFVCIGPMVSLPDVILQLCRQFSGDDCG